MTVLDDSRPSGTVAVRLGDAETAALIDALARSAASVRRSQDGLTVLLAIFGDRPDGAEEHDAILSADRKLAALLGEDVCGLEIRAVHAGAA